MSKVDNKTREAVARMLAAFSGQQSVLTIPRPYIALTEDVCAALLLSQCVYWMDRTKDPEGWFAKSYTEWDEELGMSQFQVRRAATNLKPVGLETKIKKWRGAPTVHYRVNMETLAEAIMQKLDNPIIEKLHNPLSSNSINDSEETEGSYTETTTETTPETKKTPPPKKGGEPAPRPRDAVFDAVALHIFEQEAAEAEGGRIAKIANWLKGKYDGRGKERMGKISKPAEVAHIEKFAIYCKDEGFTPPLDFVKFVEQWRRWASRQRTAPTTTPALTLEEYDAMIAQEGNDAS